MSSGSGGGRRDIIREYIRVSGLGDVTSRPSIERFNVAGLLLAIISAGFLAFFDGMISYFTGIVSGAIRLLDGLSTSLASFIAIAFNVDRAITLSAMDATVQLSTTGVAAWIIGIAVVGLMLYLVSLGVSLLE